MSNYVIKHKDLYLHKTPNGVEFLPVKHGAITYTKEDAETVLKTISKELGHVFIKKIKDKNFKQGKTSLVKPISNFRKNRAKKKLEKLNKKGAENGE